MSTTTRVTADQLLRMPDDGYRYELVAGELKRATNSPGKMPLPVFAAELARSLPAR